jgi:DNA-binding HxlR family transcriptional regulator
VPTSPVQVEYAITPLGQTLAKAVDPVRLWAIGHIEQVLESQARYDEQAT